MVIGSSIFASVDFEPDDNVNSFLSARTLMPTNSATAQSSASAAAERRAVNGVFMAGSVRLLELDEDHVRHQEDADDGGEEDGVAQVDDALDDRAEVGEEAERGDG